MPNTWKHTREAIKADVYRNIGTFSRRIVLKEVFRFGSTVGVLILYRLCHYFSEKSHCNLLQKMAHAICYMLFKRKQIICGIELNQHTQIGPGLRLPHRSGIIIHPMAVIGANCEIMQNVTLGNNIVKSRTGVPVIGNEVLICAGAKLIGQIHVGNRVVIAANAVVNHDIEDGYVAGGVPAKVLKPSSDVYLINCNYNL